MMMIIMMMMIMMMMMMIMMMMIMMMMMMMTSGTECGVHGAVSEYISILSTTELATCKAQNASLSGQFPPT